MGNRMVKFSIPYCCEADCPIYKIWNAWKSYFLKTWKWNKQNSVVTRTHIHTSTIHVWAEQMVPIRPYPNLKKKRKKIHVQIRFGARCGPSCSVVLSTTTGVRLDPAGLPPPASATPHNHPRLHRCRHPHSNERPSQRPLRFPKRPWKMWKLVS